MYRERILFLLAVAITCVASAFPAAGEDMKKVYLPWRIFSEDSQRTVTSCNGYCELTMHLYTPAISKEDVQTQRISDTDAALKCCLEVLESVSKRDMEHYRSLLCQDLRNVPESPDPFPCGFESLDTLTAVGCTYHVYGYFEINGQRVFLVDFAGKASDQPWILFFIPVKSAPICHYAKSIMGEPLQIIQDIFWNDFHHDYANIGKRVLFPVNLENPLRFRIHGVTEPKVDSDAPAVLMSWLPQDDPKVKLAENAKNAFLAVLQHQAVLADLDTAYAALKEEMKPRMTEFSWEKYFEPYDKPDSSPHATRQDILNVMRREGKELSAMLNRATGCVLSAAPDYIWIARETIVSPPQSGERCLYSIMQRWSFLQFKQVGEEMVVCGLYDSTLIELIDKPEFWTALRKEWARKNPTAK